MKLSKTQLAYIAALIDGEGYIGCQRQVQSRGKTPRFVLRIAFAMSTKEPIKTISVWVGVPFKEYPPVDHLRASTFRLGIPKEKSYEILTKCLPYLILKKRAAKIALAIEDVRAKYSPSRQHFGHPRMRPMPQIAIAKMEFLYAKLRATMSNKRPIRCR